MTQPEPFFLFFLILIAAALLTGLADRWMAALYRKNPAALSFPGRIAERGRWRRPLLLLAYFVSLALIAARWSLPASCYHAIAAFFLILVCATDFEQYVIFDRVLAFFAVLGFAAVWRLGLPLPAHLFAAAAGGALFLLLAIVTRGGIGGGDVKLIASLGIWLGPEKLLTAAAMGLIAGGGAAALLLLAKKKSRGSFFAYGPYFALSGFLVLLAR